MKLGKRNLGVDLRGFWRGRMQYRYDKDTLYTGVKFSNNK